MLRISRDFLPGTRMAADPPGRFLGGANDRFSVVDPLNDLPADGSVPACCIATIGQHVEHNPMMVCAECKNIIKCFTDERAYVNYRKFCDSRRRPIVTGRVGIYFTVAFRNYDTYGR